MKIWHEKIDPALIEAHPDNANEQTEHVFNTLTANIRKRGMLSTPLVRVAEWSGKGKSRKAARYQCIDGHHRIEAYKAAGKTEPILCIVADMTDLEAAEHLMSMNSLTGEPNTRKLGALIDKMLDELGASAVEISQHTGYSPAEIDSFLEQAAEEADVFMGLEVGGGPAPAEGEGEEEVEQWVFYVEENQGQVIHRALEQAKKLNKTESENPEADALEFVCSFFLSKKSKHLEDGVLLTVPLPVKKQFLDLWERFRAANPGKDMEDFMFALMGPLEDNLPAIAVGGKVGRVEKSKALG